MLNNLLLCIQASVTFTRLKYIWIQHEKSFLITRVKRNQKAILVLVPTNALEDAIKPAHTLRLTFWRMPITVFIVTNLKLKCNSQNCCFLWMLARKLSQLIQSRLYGKQQHIIGNEVHMFINIELAILVLTKD